MSVTDGVGPGDSIVDSSVGEAVSEDSGLLKGLVVGESELLGAEGGDRGKMKAGGAPNMSSGLGSGW